MPTSTTSHEVKRLLRIISDKLTKRDIDHSLELKDEGFWHITIVSYYSDIATRLQNDLNNGILSNVDLKAVSVSACRTNIIWFNKGKPLPYLGLNESFRYAYDYLLTENARQELEARHVQQNHTGWPAFQCIICRKDLRDVGFNIPYYDNGVWTDSPQYHKKTSKSRMLVDRLCNRK